MPFNGKVACQEAVFIWLSVTDKRLGLGLGQLLCSTGRLGRMLRLDTVTGPGPGPSFYLSPTQNNLPFTVYPNGIKARWQAAGHALAQAKEGEEEGEGEELEREEEERGGPWIGNGQERRRPQSGGGTRRRQIFAPIFAGKKNN
jgi:hypothetical protein